MREYDELDRNLATIKKSRVEFGTKEKCKIKVNGKVQTGYRARRPDGGGYYYYDSDGCFLDDALMTIMMIELFSDAYHEEPVVFSDPSTLGEAEPPGGLFSSNIEENSSSYEDTKSSFGGGYDGGYDSGGGGFDSGGGGFDSGGGGSFD